MFNSPFASVMNQSVPSNSTHSTHLAVDTTEVIPTPVQVEPIVAQTVPTNNEVEAVEETETKKYEYLNNYHLTWGTDKIVSLANGKVSKDNTKTLDFLNWINTVVVDENCLEKNEVLYVIKDKLSSDLGIKSTIKAAESLWNAMNMVKWAKRTNVKSGYTRSKVTYEW